jgi:hypothetical protein
MPDRDAARLRANPFATIQKRMCRIKFHEWHDVYWADFSIDRSLIFVPTLVHACELMQPMLMQGHFK